jgi:hypothetical protein
MIRFLIKIFLFALIFTLLTFCFNLCISKSIRNIDGTWKAIYSKQLNCDIIFSGNSRSTAHFNPEIFDSILGVKSYNIGLDGNSFESQIIRLRVYLNNNPYPKLIILNSDPFELQPTLLSNAQSYKPYMADTTVRNQLRRIKITPWYYFNTITRYYGDYNSAFMAIKELSGLWAQKDPHIKGFLPETHIFNQKELEILKESKAEEVYVNAYSTKLLYNFIQDCKQKNIEILLVQTPIYIERQNKMSNLNEFTKKITEYSKMLSLNFYDFTRDSLCYSTQYFNNTTHLNAKGSTILCKKICNEIKNNKDLMNKIND